MLISDVQQSDSAVCVCVHVCVCVCAHACMCVCVKGFPGDSAVKNPPVNAGDMGLVPGSGRSSGEGNDYPLQCSCLGNPMDKGDWWASVHGVTKSWTQFRD